MEKRVPVNYRIYNKQDGKTKNDYLREIIDEVNEWGIKAEAITTDSWYSSKLNIKFFRDKELNFGVGFKKNSSVRINQAEYVRIDSLNIPNDGLIVEAQKIWKS